MKHFLPILWWLGAIPVIALIVTSLGYPLGGAFAIAAMFLPGMLCARFFLPQLSFGNRFRGIFQCLCLVLAILILEYLMIFMANTYITQTGMDEIPPILLNPLFLFAILAAFVTPEILLERHITTRYPYDDTIRFTSDRRKITLDPEQITYIESNDSEVWIYTCSGDAYRTKTRISQWEGQLDGRFLRIHRSYIINTGHITDATANRIAVGEKTIEVSRKYRDAVRRHPAIRGGLQSE